MNHFDILINLRKTVPLATATNEVSFSCFDLWVNNLENGTRKESNLKGVPVLRGILEEFLKRLKDHKDIVNEQVNSALVEVKKRADEDVAEYKKSYENRLIAAKEGMWNSEEFYDLFHTGERYSREINAIFDAEIKRMDEFIERLNRLEGKLKSELS